MTEKGDFGRRTWDVEEYAKIAHERYQSEKNKDKAEAVEAHTPIARDSLNFAANLNKRQVVTGEVVRTRGQGFGFYCSVCDLTFKDNLKYVDHLNSKPHLIRSGELNQSIPVSLKEVKERYDMLCEKLDESMGQEERYNINERIERRKRFEEERKQEKKTKKALRKDQNSNAQKTDTDDPMASMLGFSAFGSTKK